MILDWKALAQLDDEQLAAHDVAAVNLACAAGLPGGPTEEQAAECIDRLDHYARCLPQFTQSRMEQFLADPSGYGSEARFRMVCLVRLLRNVFGVRYNPAKTDDDAPFGPADTFIHGALVGDGGSCASLPVVYVAVGRRVGYPLNLVSAWRHSFVRWDEPGGERFNFEATGPACAEPPDDHYRTGRYLRLRPDLERRAYLMVPLTPCQDLGHFLAERGIYWEEAGRFDLALEAFDWALRLMPGNFLLRNRIIRLFKLMNLK